MGSATFTVQMVRCPIYIFKFNLTLLLLLLLLGQCLYMAVVVYAPALALSQGNEVEDDISQ